MNEYAIFYSKFKDSDMHAVAEFVLFIKEKSAQPAASAEEEKKGEAPKVASKPIQSLGIGFCVIPLFGPANALLSGDALSVNLLQGSPRLVLSGKDVAGLKKSAISISYSVVYSPQNEKNKQLMFIIPSEILVGPNDMIPGIVTTKMPAQFPGLEMAQLEFNERKTLYAHDIRITAINDIESSFNNYLRQLCIKVGADQGNEVTAEVMERKLTVVPHNTWKQIGEEAMISLNKD